MILNGESILIVGRAYRLGVNPITTTLVLLGPLLIALITVMGRNALTIGLGIRVYILAPRRSGVPLGHEERGGQTRENVGKQ